MSNKIIVFITIFLLVGMWITFIVFLNKQAETIRTDPCLQCSKRVGSDVICTTNIMRRIYYPNGSYKDESLISQPIESINYTEILQEYVNGT